jgi:methylaspartate mutase epsilon subunit
MDLLQREREAIINNEYVDHFDFEEVSHFIKNASKDLFISHRFKDATNILVQPRGGFPTYEKVFKLYEEFKAAGVDILPLTIDSNTRLNDYASAKKMLRLSEENDVDMLNGYPLVNHGYRSTRKMITHFNTPVSLRHGTPDARLLTEIALASGIFEIEGGPITYLLPYSKNFPLDKAFIYWKYVEKVCAKYSTLNEPINRESFGPLSATMQPPVIVLVIQILEMLLSLEEGVKSFSVSFSQTGSFIQDIVSANVLKKLARKYADDLGFKDASIHLVYHQWMGAFPRNKEHSESLITTSTVLAGLVGADKIITKTKEEAFGIPTKEANASAVSNVKYTLGILKGLPKISDEEEEENLTREVEEIMQALFNDPADTLWRKIFNAIKKGYIEIPFSPHIINNNKVITLRDSKSNIRIYDKGDLPLSEKSFAFERAKLHLAEDKNALVSQIIQDIGIML